MSDEIKTYVVNGVEYAARSLLAAKEAARHSGNNTQTHCNPEKKCYINSTDKEGDTK